MADNITVKDANGLDVVLKTTDIAGVHVPAHQLVDLNGNPLTLQQLDATINLDDLQALVAACTMHARVSDTEIRGVRMDKSSYALTTIDYDHHEVHDGSKYMVTGHGAFSNNDTIDFVVVTPAGTKHAHMRMLIGASAGASLDVYENATYTGGTAATPQNQNRNYANASILTVLGGPFTTLTPGTNLIFSQQYGNATVSGGGGFDAGMELILKSATTYLFRITSLANGNDISYNGNWYEHTDRSL